MLRTAQPAVPSIPALSMARAQSLAEQAANAIVAGISAGALLPGQRIIETELASLLNMSRVPLREALKILEVQGILESVPHRGTRVATFDDLRVNQICQARIALERLSLADAAPICKRDPVVLARLEQIIVDMERSAERMEWIEISKADLSFHREICRLSGNAIVATLKWIHSHTPEEIMAKMPDELIGPDKALYLAALKNTMPMYSTTGRMDPKGAQAVLDVFSQSSPEVKNAKIDLSKTYTNKFIDAATGAK